VSLDLTKMTTLCAGYCAGRFKTNDTTQLVLDDKLDDAGELVAKMGGAAVIIPKEHIPTEIGVACVFRY